MPLGNSYLGALAVLENLQRRNSQLMLLLLRSMNSGHSAFTITVPRLVLLENSAFLNSAFLHE